MQDLIIQQPQRADGSGAELFLLFHGVGSNAEKRLHERLDAPA